MLWVLKRTKKNWGDSFEHQKQIFKLMDKKVLGSGLSPIKHWLWYSVRHHIHQDV